MTSRPLKHVSTKGVTTWQIAWRYGGTRDGTRQSRTEATRPDALRLQAAIEARGHLVYARDPEVRSGALIGRATPTQVATVGVMWPQVVAEYRAQATGQRTSSLEAYERIFRLHLSRWDDRRIDAITRADIADLMRDYSMVRGGRGAHILVQAKAVLRYAKEQGYIVQDPSTKVRFESTAKLEHIFWSRDEQALILAAAEEVQPYLGRIVSFALGTGLRHGELCGLRRRDFAGLDADTMWLTVSRSADRKVISPTKSGKTRTIRLGPTLSAAVKVRLREIPRGNDAWFWPAVRKPDSPVTQESLRYRFDKVIDRAVDLGLDPSQRGTVQDLRHTHASNLINDKVPMLEVSQRLGHSSIAVTEKHYASLGQPSLDALLRSLG